MIVVVVGLGLNAGPFRIERSAVIDAPAEVVHARLDDLHEWTRWFPWLKLDEHVRKHRHSGPAKGVGATYEWESDVKVGRNRMTIIESQPDRIVARLQFIYGRSREYRLIASLRPQGDKTKVQLALTGQDTYATRLFGRYKDYMGTDLDKALRNLAELLRKSAAD